MNFPIDRRIRGFATGMALAAMIFTTALSNPSLLNTQVNPQGSKQIQLDPNRIGVIKSQPIPFKPIEMLDPRTGKPVPPDSVITLRNGKKVKAADYYAELNRIEKTLNALGYSLRHPGTINLQEAIVDKARLQQQAQAIAAAHNSSQPRPESQSLRPEVFQKKYSDQRLDPALKQKLAQARTNPQLIDSLLSWTKRPNPTAVRTWDLELGNPSVFSVYNKGMLKMDALNTGTGIKGETSFGGSAFDKSLDLLRLQAAWSAPSAGTMNAQLNVFAAGYNIYNLNENQPSPYTKNGSASKQFDFPYNYHFTLFEIPMSATVGVRGSAGIDYWVQLQPVSAAAVIHPSVLAKGYAQAGPDVGIARVFAGGELTVLNDKLVLAGVSSLYVDPSGTPHFDVASAAYNEFEALDGKLYVGACIETPFGDQCAKQTLWDWPGVKRDGYLFNTFGSWTF